MLNTGSRKTISGDIVGASVKQARRDLIESVHKAVLKPLSDKDREFLYAMAQDQEVSSMSDIRSRMGVSAAYVQQYRIRLLESGVIDQVSRGKVEFAVPYLREYLRGELTI
jgi:DNA-directed RNA polymerase specialized sigma subunit